MEEKKAATDELIVSIGREKAVVDEAVEAGRGDEEAAAALQVRSRIFTGLLAALTTLVALGILGWEHHHCHSNANYDMGTQRVSKLL